jgi:hypothetical protein
MATCRPPVIEEARVKAVLLAFSAEGILLPMTRPILEGVSPACILEGVSPA